eukprot:jgi/Galph1/2245/GphlegSOOS_G921.1
MQRVLVFGATGKQGVSRNPSSEKANRLSKRGVEIVQGDLLDPPEKLQTLMQGVYAAFGVTDFYSVANQPEGPEAAEVKCGQNFILAAKAAGIPVTVLSTLPSTYELTDKKVYTPHFESKAKITNFAQQVGLPIIFARPYAYYENLYMWLTPNATSNDTMEFSLPLNSSSMLMTSVYDFGGVVAALVERANAYIGQTVDVAFENINMQSMAEQLTRALEKPVTYKSVPVEQFQSYPFPFAKELGDMFAAYRIMFDQWHLKNFDLETCKTLYPEYKTIENWAKEHKNELLACAKRK